MWSHLYLYLYFHCCIFLHIPFSAPLLELAQDKDVRQLLEVGRQLFTNSNITVRSISVLITSGIFDHVIVGWYVWRLRTLSSPCHLVDSPLFWYMSYEMLTLPEQSRHAFDDGFYQNFTVIKHIIGSSGRQDAHFSPILTSRCVQNNPTMLENVS